MLGPDDASVWREQKVQRFPKQRIVVTNENSFRMRMRITGRTGHGADHNRDASRRRDPTVVVFSPQNSRNLSYPPRSYGAFFDGPGIAEADSLKRGEV